MINPKKTPSRSTSKGTLDDDKTLGDGRRNEGRASDPDTGKRVAVVPEKELEPNGALESEGSFVQDIEHQAATPSQDSTANASSRGLAIVPKSQRRGWFGRLVIIPEVEEPKDYDRWTKWFITFVIAMAAIAAPFASSIILPSLQDIAQDFGTTASTTNFSIGLYMLSLAIFPLFWSSFCESLGRRPIYLISFALFIVFNVLAALSVNIAMFIVMRLLSGGASASVQVVGAGTLADVWHVKERGRAMGFFYLGPLMGPLLSPIIGGALQVRWGWRSTMWFLVIYAFLTFNLLFWCLPETLKSTRSIMQEIMEQENAGVQGSPELTRMRTSQSVKVKGKIWLKVLKRLFIDPLRVVKYLKFPAVSITIYYASITFGSLYTLQVSVQGTFSEPPYRFNSLQLGASYISNSVGYLMASFFGGKWVDSIMAREARKADRKDENGDLIYRPEDRMRENAWFAAFLYPAALIVYGWTAERGVFYVVPLIANFFFGIGSMLIFGMSSTMLTEFMPKKASTGMALNNLCRNILSFIGAVVAEPLMAAIGDGWLFTGIGVIAAGSSIVIWAMRHYGPKWRATMDAQLD